jgi:outer membrane receptor protein involved in Fe transport
VVPAGDRRHLHPGHGALTARGALPFLAAALASAASLAGRDEPGKDPPPRLQDRITVTAARSGARVAETPASVAVLPRAALDATAAAAVDDALRQVVGFSLFRRAGSRAANPTTQGVSLRGLGASGASRALVLADGLPLNDPFGSWVYWARVPRLAIERIEVLRGGASDLYGGGALGGVVQVVSRLPSSGRGIEAEASAGSEATIDASLSARGGRGDWSGRLSAEGYRTDGYVPVDEASRGAIDTEAASRHVAVDATVERRVSHGGRVFLRGMVYDEDRENGTAAQENDTRIGTGALGLDWGGPEQGRGQARLWGAMQLYHQTFSAVAPDRSSEDLTRTQRVPADAFGLTLQWTRLLGARHRVLGGLEAQQVDGETQETALARGAATTAVEAGGRIRTAAFFVQDLFQVHPRLLVTASARLDGWALREGRSETTPVATGSTTKTAFPDRSETALSPRLGLLFRASSAVSLTGSGYGAFRGPTLNELYRSFRLGDTLTLANPGLDAERLWGGEVGSLVRRGPATLRLTAFSSEVRDAVANVTVATSPGLVTRQRRNVARVRSRGVELEAELLLGSRTAVTAGYALTDARVRSFPDEPSLEGRRLPQVPRHQATFQVRYESRWRLGAQARWSSAPFEDDRNELSLDSALLVDLRAGREIADGVELFAAAENVFDAEVAVARTPVPSLGAPRLLRGGVRLRLF